MFWIYINFYIRPGFCKIYVFFKSCWEKSNCCLCCCCCSCCCTLSLPPVKVLLCCSSEFGQLLGEGVSCTAVPSSVVTNTWSSHLVILICFKISEAKESMSWNYLKVNSFWLHIMHLLLIHFKIMEKICMVSHDRSNCQSITINTQWSRGNVKKPQNRGIKGGVGWGWWNLACLEMTLSWVFWDGAGGRWRDTPVKMTFQWFIFPVQSFPG